jgi:hypothetical protein
MCTWRKWFTVGPLTLVLVWFCASAAADIWLTPTPTGGAALSDSASAAQVTTADRGPEGFQVGVSLGGFIFQPQKTEAGEFVSLLLPDEPAAGEIGTPALPVIRRLFVVPDGVDVVTQVWTGPPAVANAETLGRPLRLMPVQPPIEKVPGALENTPFAFDPTAYAADVDYAPQRVTVSELGIVRNQRLFMLEIWPLSYNPAAGQVTFWTDISVQVRFVGQPLPPSPLAPLPGLRSIVLNPSQVPARMGRGTGNYLIIVVNTLQSDIASFAAAKSAQGYTVSTYPVASGTSNTTIKNYIQSLWNTPNAPDYILLVGDSGQIPHWTGGGAGSPPTDLPYACMDGSSDWYPDIAIGRFPATNSTQLQAMVDKTLYYENGPLADPNYLKRSVWMASEDNYPVSEGTHNWVIDNYMIPNEIAYNKLYCHTYNATTQQVRDCVNNGRFYIVYSGHGSETSWADGPPFSQSDVSNLVNANLYGLVYSFACLTGNFTVSECFMETWIRVANRGAAAAIGSSVTSYWTEDDILEKRLFDSIFDDGDDVVAEIGPVWNDTKMRYLAYFGPTSTTRRYFEMYNILGDPALPYPGRCSDAGVITLNQPHYQIGDTVRIRVVDCGLNTNPNAVETVVITINSSSEPAGESVLLTETNPNSAQFEGAIVISATNAPGVLLVSVGDTITATYIDADDGQGHYNVVRTATATVVYPPPTIATQSLPAGCLNRNYNYQMQVDGGQPPLDWSIVQTGQYVETDLGSSQFSAVGTAQNWRADDQAWSYTLPFAFPFYGQNWTSCYVCSNGFINFGSSSTAYSNSDSGLIAACRIAPLWDDLRTDTTGSDIFIQASSSQCTIRWAATTYSGGYPVNVAVTLYPDGRIRFHYGSGNTGLSPTIGISAGDGTNYLLSTYNNASTLTNANSHEFARISPLPPGITLSSSGLLSGTPTQTGTFNPRIRVTDSLGRSDERTFTLVINQTCPFDLGDLNCDGQVNAFDIDPFVLALTNPAAYNSTYPNCNLMLGDVNSDGQVNAFDIDPFVLLLTGK